MKRVLAGLTVIIVIILDQLSKLMIVNNMEVRQSFAVIDNFFSITYIKNTGAAFGMFADKQLILAIITGIIMAAVIAVALIKADEIEIMPLLCIASFIGGGIGNLIDRLLRGYVVDFLDFKVWSPVFNVADIFVCTGCICLMLYILFFEGKRNGRKN